MPQKQLVLLVLRTTTLESTVGSGSGTGVAVSNALDAEGFVGSVMETGGSVDTKKAGVADDVDIGMDSIDAAAAFLQVMLSYN